MGRNGVPLSRSLANADKPIVMTRVVSAVWGIVRAATRPFFTSFEPCYRLPRVVILGLGLVSILALATIDWAIGPERGVAILYVMAIMAVTFHASWVDGAVVAIIASAAGLLIRVVGSYKLGIATGLWSLFSELAVFLTLVLIISQVRRLVDSLEQQGRVDPLSGALNTRGLFELLERERSRADRHERPMTVVFADLDDMKGINDRLGHSGGDEVLRTFSEKVRSSIRDEDLLARVGGDEFVVILPDTGQRQAVIVVARLRRRVGPKIPASYGVVTFLRQPESIEDLISAADAMMYAAKQAGGNRVAGEVRRGGADQHEPSRPAAIQVEAGTDSVSVA